MEIWKDIKGYEGLYQVSNLGRVKSLSKKYGHGKRNEKIMACSLRKDGYISVSLFKKSKGKTFGVHRLVAEAFIPNPDNLPQVNHKDENKQNNYANNLEFCTKKYNMNYGTRKERAYSKTRKHNIIQCDLNGNVIKIWECAYIASKKLNIKQSGIYRCCMKKQDVYKGYVWKYADDNNLKELR